MGTRGVWSLENVEIKKPQDDWVPVPNVFTQQFLDDAGYIAGGETAPGPHTSRVDKIAYSTDTKSTLSNSMYTTRRGMGASSSPTAGYIMGGFSPDVPNGPYSTKIDKLTYATQTIALVPGNFADEHMFGAAGGGSTTAGYLLQGGNPYSSYVRKVTYATDSIELLPGRVSGPRAANGKEGSAGNGDLFLYIMGGADSDGSNVRKLTYASDTVSPAPNMPTPGSLNRMQKDGCSSSTLAAYIVGGSNPYNSRIDKITFSNDTTSYVTNSTVPTNNGRINVAGTGLPSAGYFSGGTSTSITEKITMSNENCSRVPALDLTSGIGQGVGFSSKSDNHPAPKNLRWVDDAAPAPPFALWAGGYIDASPIDRTSQVAKWTYSTGTGEVLPSSNLGERTSASCSVGAPEAGYWKGGYGYPGPGSYWSYTWKCVYSTETTSEIPGLRGGNPGWSSGRTTAGLAVGNTEKGYFGAGSPSFTFSHANASLSRVPWATETNHNFPGGVTLRNPVMFITGAGSQEVGYALGGQQSNGNTLSYVDKLTYATDSRSAGGNMTNYHYLAGSASSDTASYCFGGTNSNSIVDKYVWATDTCSADTNLTSPAQNGTNANGKNDAGLLAGGNSKDSSVQKYTYSTSTSSMEPGNMGYGARYMGGASASNNNGPSALAPNPTPTPTTTSVYPATLVDFGYQQGGLAGGHDQKDVMKLTFANDTAAEMPGADLPANRHYHATFSSTLASYVSGGKKWPNITNDSTIDKTVYATDTSSNVVNGSSDNLEPGRHKCAGAMNSTNGWTIGGSSQGQSRVDKFFFSSETNQGDGTLSDSPGPNGRWWFSTLSAPEHIYCVGGENRSNYWKFTYSISSQQQVPGATIPRLSAGIPGTYGAKAMTQGIGNSTQGYAGGGMSGSNPITNIDKIVYATDTVTSGVAALLSGRYGVSNLGTDIQGYWLGGRENPGSPAWDNRTTTKMPFSTDTLAIAPGAWDSSYNTRYSGFGSGAKSFGSHRTATPNVI